MASLSFNPNSSTRRADATRVVRADPTRVVREVGLPLVLPATAAALVPSGLGQEWPGRPAASAFLFWEEMGE